MSCHRKGAFGLLFAASAAFLGLTGSAVADDGIDTVTVTAEKTSESILKVGINVTAISAEDLRTSRIDTATDLSGMIPNVDVKSNIPGAQQIITIRGVGLDDFSSTNNSSVGVYVDDIFLASFAEMDFNFFDLDRIELLKGPQGTLYGRNSTAGAINVISAKPDFDGLSGFIAAGYANFQTFDANGFINVPVSDTFALRFSARTIRQDEGYYFSRTLNRDLGRQDIWLGRAQALWNPSDTLSILFKLEGERSRSEIGVGKFFGTGSLTATPCPDFSDPSHCVNAHLYTDTTTDPFKGDWNHVSPNHVDRWSATAKIEDDLGWATLTSVTGYIDFKRGFYTDADAAPTTDAEFDQNDKVHQFSEELRLAGTSGAWDWQAGAYYSRDRVQTHTPGFLNDLFGTEVLIEADQKTTSAALFGQTKYHINQQVTLTGGLRLTNERRSYTGGTTDLNPTGFSVLCFFNIPACPFGTPGDFVLSHEDATIHDTNWSWRGALNWNPDDDTLFYASISRATKSGGFFNGITTNSFALAPYKPEQLTDYEAGVKANVANHTLLVDASVFYYDYTDLQAQTFTSVGAVSLIKLGNIHHATIYGLDLDATWVPVDGLTFRAGLGLLHTKLGAFSVGVPVPEGNKLPDAPNVSFNGSVRYEHAIFGDYLGAVQFSTDYAGKVFKEALNTPYLVGGAYWTYDARASIATQDGNWELAFWGKNLFDEKHVVQATDDGVGMGYRVFNAPRTYGATLTHKFE